MTKPKGLRGIETTATGYRAYVRVKGFPLKTKRFRHPVDVAEVRLWRETTRSKLIVRREEQIADAPTPETFRADVPRYLPAVKALPSYTERVRDISIWLPVFDTTPSLEIDALTIRTMRDQWLTVGPRWVQKKGGRVLVNKPLAAGTVNHRLRALSNFFTVLYPKHDNPVKDVEEADAGEPVPRSVSYVVIKAVLKAMTDQGRALKDQLREDFSAAKVRAHCLAWSGVTPTELERLQPADNRWRENLIIVGARRKGRGAPGRVVPLTKEGRAAFRELHRRALYGEFNVGVVNRALALACEAAQLPRITCYTFRHSYITGVVRATKNLKLGGMLAGHRDDRTTHRYRMAAELEVLQHGVGRFGKAVGGRKRRA